MNIRINVKKKNRKKIAYFIVGIIATLAIQFLIINVVLGYPIDPNSPSISFTNVRNGAVYLQGDINVIRVGVISLGPLGINVSKSYFQIIKDGKEVSVVGGISNPSDIKISLNGVGLQGEPFKEGEYRITAHVENGSGVVSEKEIYFKIIKYKLYAVIDNAVQLNGVENYLDLQITNGSGVDFYGVHALVNTCNMVNNGNKFYQYGYIPVLLSGTTQHIKVFDEISISQMKNKVCPPAYSDDLNFQTLYAERCFGSFNPFLSTDTMNVIASDCCVLCDTNVYLSTKGLDFNLPTTSFRIPNGEILVGN